MSEKRPLRAKKMAKKAILSKKSLKKVKKYFF